MVPNLPAAVAQAHAQAISFSDIVYRSIHVGHFANFATVNPLFAAGGGQAGSRYVRPNGPRVLYTSLDAETAYREGNQLFHQMANSPAGPTLRGAGLLRPDPVVLIGIHVRVSRLLDLRNQSTQAHFATTTNELLGPWQGIPNPPTQLLGDAVFNDGYFQGMRFPSAQNPGHECLALFTTRLVSPDRVYFFGGSTLPSRQIP